MHVNIENLNKATAEGDLMGFRGILCLFWARRKVRPLRETGKGRSKTDGWRKWDRSCKSESAGAGAGESACMQAAFNTLHCGRTTWGITACPIHQFAQTEKKRQTNTLWCQTSKMFCIISWERIRWMIMRWIIWFRKKKKKHNYPTWALTVTIF